MHSQGPRLGRASPTLVEKPPAPCPIASQPTPGLAKPEAAEHPVSDVAQDVTGCIAQDGHGPFPIHWAGWTAPRATVSRPWLQAIVGQLSRCLPLRPWRKSGAEPPSPGPPNPSPRSLVGLRSSRCVRAPGARNPARHTSLGRSRPRGGSRRPYLAPARDELAAAG